MVLAVLRARRGKERRGQSDIEVAVQVEIGGPLAKVRGADVEVGRAGRTVGQVQGRAFAVMDLVLAIGGAEVPVNVPEGRTLDAEGGLVIDVLQVEPRDVAIGIYSEDITDAGRITVGQPRVRIAIGNGGERVQLRPLGQGQSEVVSGVVAHDLGLSGLVDIAVGRGLARIGRAVDQGIKPSRIGTATDGTPLVADAGAQVQRAA